MAWPSLLKTLKQNTGWLVPHCSPLQPPPPKMKPTLLTYCQLSSVERHSVFDSLCLTIHTYCGGSYRQLRTMQEWISLYSWKGSAKAAENYQAQPGF